MSKATSIKKRTTSLVFLQSSTPFPSCSSSASHIASSIQYSVPFPKVWSAYGNELRRNQQQKLSSMNSNGYMSLQSNSILGTYLVIIVRALLSLLDQWTRQNQHGLAAASSSLKRPVIVFPLSSPSKFSLDRFPLARFLLLSPFARALDS